MNSGLASQLPHHTITKNKKKYMKKGIISEVRGADT